LHFLNLYDRILIVCGLTQLNLVSLSSSKENSAFTFGFAFLLQSSPIPIHKFTAKYTHLQLEDFSVSLDF